MSDFERGSEWRQWDLHIHTPASFHWEGKKFSGEILSPENILLIDEMIAAINLSEPAVFALMDYWTFDGWFALKKRLAQPGAPKLEKIVFPGIELRLMAPMNARLNAHVIFSNEVKDQDLIDFKSALEVELIKKPLSDGALMDLARIVGPDKLKHHGFDSAVVNGSDIEALRAGSVIAELNCESYKNAIEKFHKGMAIGFMPFDTNDGLSQVKWTDHYAYVLGLFNSSPIFETRNNETWAAFSGVKTEKNSSWFDNFQYALKGIPRLAVSGSDAHKFVGVKGDNNNRGYGDFPSGKKTWIKADTTFYGLLQAIKEPAKRSYIGECPEKLTEINENKTFFIDSVEINKIQGAVSDEMWLDDVRLRLNPDLVAVIGNKGSGKSALADIIALLGNSKQSKYFSFLRRDRFRGKNGYPAKEFTGRLSWLGGVAETRNLAEDPAPEKFEMVRYIPQGHFEGLCNDHVYGVSDAFEQELRSVIFSHVDADTRLGAMDFDQLVNEQERGYRERLSELRNSLRSLNERIEFIEGQLQPSVRATLVEMLTLINTQIDEHNKIRPIQIEKPTDELTDDQIKASVMLDEISQKMKALDGREALRIGANIAAARKLNAIKNIRDRVGSLERAYLQFEAETAQDFEILGLNIREVLTISVSDESLLRISNAIPTEQAEMASAAVIDGEEKAKLKIEQDELNAHLNAPQAAYQARIREIEMWTLKHQEITGRPDLPDTLEGVKARISQLDEMPNIYAEIMNRRIKISSEIFSVLEEQRNARALLFKPVQDLIQENYLIRDEYKLQFQAVIGASIDNFSESLFSMIKQNAGDFRGDNEGATIIKTLSEQFDMNTNDGAVKFVESVYDKVLNSAKRGAVDAIGIENTLRKDKKNVDNSSSKVYDLIFGLEFLESRYSLLFQDAQIEQLSPGQRGALLLIFYLLVDKGRNPIILDQPEENLDNETVVSLLVPVLAEAKKKRQIIMVAHNPNLAVVCDAEQIIYSKYDRKNKSTISYCSGSIENPEINIHVVNVLEGTKPAFNNRKFKYH
ncbi:MAG: ABC transporter [Cellvibrionales bacterium]|nr:ABC transporter [Cellvibrionales bacterium]